MSLPIALMQMSLPAAVYIQELAKRGTSFWNAPQQLVFSSSPAPLMTAVTSGSIDALATSNRQLGKLCSFQYILRFLRSLPMERGAPG